MFAAMQGFLPRESRHAGPERDARGIATTPRAPDVPDVAGALPMLLELQGYQFQNENCIVRRFGLAILEKRPVTTHIVASDLHDQSSDRTPA